MLRPLLIIIAVIFSSQQLKAQKLFIGPELGMNLIQVEEQEIGNDFQPAWYGGGAVDYKFNDWISLRTGLYFSQSRHSYSSEDTSVIDFLGGLIDSSMAIPGIDLNTYTTINGRQSQYYIQIPVQANFSWKKIQLFVGGYAGFMVGAKQKETTIERTPVVENLDFESLGIPEFIASFLPAAYDESFSENTESSDFRSFDYGLKAGLGYQMDQFGVQASYSFGIPDYRVDRGDEDIRRNQFFQFSIRYMLPIGGKSGSSSIH